MELDMIWVIPALAVLAGVVFAYEMGKVVGSDRDYKRGYEQGREAGFAECVLAIDQAPPLIGGEMDADLTDTEWQAEDPPQCADCGEFGVLTGHMGCQFPQDRP